MGCFAMVCGKEQQNVIRRKQELKEKGNLKTRIRIPFQWYAEQGAQLEIKWDEPPIHVVSAPLIDEFPKLVAREGNGNTYANPFQIIVRAKPWAPWNRSMYPCVRNTDEPLP